MKKFTKTQYQPQENQLTDVKTDYKNIPIFTNFRGDVEKKFHDLDWKIYAIILFLLVMVAGIIVDTVIFHIQDNRWHNEYNLRLEERIGK